jgi:hypothetical protein
MYARQERQRGFGIAMFLLVVACAIIALGGGIQTGKAAPGPSLRSSTLQLPADSPTGCDQATWQIVPSPNYTVTSNILRGVAVYAPNDAWAVGSYGTTSYVAPLVEHWDGASWSLMPNNASDGSLYGAAAIASDDVWAVGNQGGASLAMHWNGDDWTVVSTPNVSTTVEMLFGVAAVSSDDVWAVGRIGNDMPGAPLILHWDGASWASVQATSPTVPQNYPTTLYGVDALPSGDVWAVGIREAVTHTSVSLVMHYDGEQWTQSPIPIDIGDLSSIEAISPDDVWAVGTDWDSSSGHIVSRTIHWDGQTWSVVPSPPGTQGCNLFGVAAEASGRVWAVGQCLTGSNPTQSFNLVMLWDGSQWSVVESPNINGAQYNRLNGVAVAQPGDIIAVGLYGSASGYSTLTERNYDPSCTPTATPVPPSATSTPVPTNTLAPPPATTVATSSSVPASATTLATSTSVPPTDTAVTTATASIPTDTPAPPASTSTSIPTATTTSCAITFTDVPDDNVFYPYVLCLACNGILGGYDDGTFRPNNDVTRGQIAKIVSRAAGLQDDPGPQMYEDVDSSNPFYIWINRLSNRGYMSGYLCGGPDEPCGPDNLPYFRPFGNATRGQVAKIVSNTLVIEDDPGQQIYEDVPPDHPFFLWIQRVGHLNIMNGYDCGGPGEPCSCYGPCNYFRAFSNATRGQTAKIAANAFFPNCTSR